MKLEVSVRKRYENFSFEADFSVQGARIGVFGPSGSGKSTLMHLLAGLLPADAGFIHLDGVPLYQSARGIEVPARKRRIAVVFQHAHLFPHLSVRANLLYGYKRIARAERRIDPDTLCEVLHLGPLLGRGVNALSGGERQRVALGRAVLAHPRLILMDEPVTGLDEGLKYQILPYLKQTFAAFGIPLIFISHSLTEMRLMTDEVLEFEDGRLTAQSGVEDLARRRLASSPVGYINHLRLEDGRAQSDLWDYRWGENRLILSSGNGVGGGGVFELSSKDVTLFKQHPEATSARNILRCRVSGIFPAGNRVGVDLDCGGAKLVSQVVGEAARDLELHPGRELFAVIKASAFRRLC
ncbi:molybdate transport system ATP-binding protein [Geoalkalibacter ferrihydriticus]|uniref:Molybdenum ABC transporter ATP-binding protein n=2 Tax=Geoalkalibacter ferrihydriticus TaxID=392333 RepID=A0A0C2HME0_9BACT|nr:molybdenum ABC transporter ATP-binding protein [Geoalkalibacter ferrihydriticus]KIH76120.1 molybdenum ABC transporter ATP-binding protein [Geoalkalibacter ferrihydriticus DSM 17813]SDM44402.1 molybdate transport system ATP-binding protein [Geoalkalibacter ferrihydriticus]